ncbi:hypothetical protein ACLOJK_040212 [Asimina triloba]
MGSSYYGEPSLGNGRSGSSSRKGKKSNSEKPKQPQRGLGVAQLEKIRLRNQMGCGYLPSFHSPCHANLNQEEDARLEMAFSPSVSSSCYPSPSPSPYGFHPNIVILILIRWARETWNQRTSDLVNPNLAVAQLAMPDGIPTAISYKPNMPLSQTSQDTFLDCPWRIQRRRKEGMTGAIPWVQAAKTPIQVRPKS